MRSITFISMLIMFVFVVLCCNPQPGTISDIDKLKLRIYFLAYMLDTKLTNGKDTLPLTSFDIAIVETGVWYLPTGDSAKLHHMSLVQVDSFKLMMPMFDKCTIISQNGGLIDTLVFHDVGDITFYFLDTSSHNEAYHVWKEQLNSDANAREWVVELANRMEIGHLFGHKECGFITKPFSKDEQGWVKYREIETGIWCPE